LQLLSVLCGFAFGAHALHRRVMTVHERPTVLLVEDDRATREMYDYALRIAEYSVLQASDGLAALRLLDQQLPDAMVLDLDLPHLSGMDVQREVMSHAETRSIPFVVVTGTDWKPAGIQILRKPVTPEVLVAAVDRALTPPLSAPKGAVR
jgi:DNA-binding response OmpR family regulator